MKSLSNGINYIEGDPECSECACYLFHGKFCTRNGCYLRGIPQLATGVEIWAPPTNWPGRVNLRFCRFNTPDGSRSVGHFHQCRYLAKFMIQATIDGNETAYAIGFCQLHKLQIEKGSP